MKPVTSFDVVGAFGAPRSSLPSGVLFWRAFGKNAGATGTTPSPTWEMIVGARSAPVDTSWGTTPDFNGDGAADVLVGAVGADNGSGRAYVYLSGPVGLPKVPSVILSGEAGSNFGRTLGSAGDVNGDGFADVVVGSIGSAGIGHVYLYLGAAMGFSSSPATTITGSDGFTSNFAASVASAGDVNGDGYADVLVGADLYANGGGRVYLFLGGAAGLSQSPAATINGVSGGQFGFTMASAGDVNGDGYADVVIGAPGVTIEGRAYVYLGGASGLGSTPSTVLAPLESVARSFGNTVAGAGDINGDGYADVVIGAPGTGVARAYVYLGSAAGVQFSPAARLIPADTTASTFGASAALGGDVNGDGFADVVIGDPSYRPSGVAYLYLGGSSGVGAAPSVTLVGIEDGGNFGNAVATAGDLDGDGLADLVIGASNVVNGEGRVYLYIGNPMTGVSSGPSVTFMGVDGSLSYFGIVVASVQGRPARIIKL